ncbi:MAG TPA: 6-phosphogluconolactonase [Acidimicrobiales bacterium]|nr:6-phosphogluconolactonase [Acidimicrobiales bacterium]
MATPADVGRIDHRRVELLDINVYASRAEAGAAAASVIEDLIVDRLASNDVVRIVFASAPSQLELLAALRASTRIAWARVVAFHMDEYVGLSADAPQRFSSFLRRELFEAAVPGAVNLIDPSDPLGECLRYESKLREAPIDLVCCGVGENGHLAFNEPGASSFVDDRWVRVVPLTQESRQQQLNDGCFASLSEVPSEAITVTIPALFSARHIVAVVPGSRKAAALSRVMHGPVDEGCPATILRRHASAALFADEAAFRPAR